MVYHVQTEDKGLTTPLILSLVYAGGEILASKRSPYRDLIAAGYDPANMPEDKKPNFENAQDDAKAWKNVWSAGQGVGVVTGIEPIAQIVERLNREYVAACSLPRFDAKE